MDLPGSKAHALCPPGCYPRCPKDRPIYDEDLKKCVTGDECGCYVEDKRYLPGETVPPEDSCISWYLSQHHTGPGVGPGAHAGTATHARTPHGHVCPHIPHT